jgi:hypothetical protein
MTFSIRWVPVTAVVAMELSFMAASLFTRCANPNAAESRPTFELAVVAFCLGLLSVRKRLVVTID